MSAALTAPTRVHLTRWVVRLHRPALYLWTALILALAAALLWLAGPLADAAAEAWQRYNACADMGPCAYDQDAILRYKDYYEYATYAVLAVPFLVAAWSGASLIGREVENGTARLAWTQGLSPVRWLATKLALPALLVTVGTGALVALHRHAWVAGDGRIDTAKSWSDFATFYASGPVVVALALTGLVAGALIGLRRASSFGALGGGLCVTAFLWFGIHLLIPHLWSTVTKVTPMAHNVGPSGNGISVTQGVITATGARIADAHCTADTTAQCQAYYADLDAVSWFNDYHPAAHYWPLQWIATGILLAVTALLTVVTFRGLRRRTTTPEGAAV
ncbi:ABC transporter permease [Streptomyces fulvoviolaceus]|uniref:ABC transporter permease n=1 Tax=Streptomyces fulvoviolaceus TaxID=285535 RepID=UPI000693DB9F|nr:ABC transporter permease [Streptomyces fulvoviolaceus]